MLPSNLTVDAPLLPPIDKMGVTALTTLLLCLAKGTQVPPPPVSIPTILCGTGYVLAPILTSFQNSYELHTAGLSIPGFYPLDGIKIAGRNLLMLAPFYIGTHFLQTERARRILLQAFPTAILFYSLPMLFEVRFSPQLHRWIYGYHPSDFTQQVRSGGFRPVVLTEHGLALAFFTSLAFIAAVILVRAKVRIHRFPAGGAATYVAGMLVLCKSLGPMIYAAVLTPAILVMRPRTWTRIALILALIVCAYPAIRTYGLSPTERISAFANSFSAERAASFETRVQNENVLLAKANERPVFGWGTWGRNQIFDQYTGKATSVTDGGWIIQYGIFGWFGYLSLFGFLAMAVFRANSAIGSEVNRETIEWGGLTLMLGVYLIDQIPNATPMTFTLLIAGSIARPRSAAIRRIRQRNAESQILRTQTRLSANPNETFA